ncbi:MAG: hypothetical protein ACI9BW_001073 [Gammaproteobacteria bacterium]
MGKLLKNLALIAFVLVATLGATAAAESKLDVRLLIDVSGSMKSNDPENLRIPAVALVAELMPQGATAGIWTFAERVEQILAPREVDSKWKTSALKAAKKIHSRGQFTDIEAAITQSTRAWLSNADSDTTRHLILLTDGVVDVAKDPATNAVSRDRILKSLLRQLEQSGVKIHTIALSHNSDRELLTTLAETTDAWSEQVDNAESLQRAFLHMFEQAANPDSLPLNDKRFEVDSSITEMTLLIFHSAADEPLQLTRPNGEVLAASDDDSGVNWRVENGYELVTVSAPEVGSWQTNADPDPDNRVLIVTDVKLAVTPLPSNFFVNDSLIIGARLTESGTPIARLDFLKILDAQVEISSGEGSDPIGVPLVLDEAAANFSAQRAVDWGTGDYDYVVTVDGRTFQRQHRGKLRVNAAPLTFSSAVIDDGTAIEISIQSDRELIEPRSLAGFVVITKPDGGTDVIDLPSSLDEEFKILIPGSIGGTYQIEVHAMGRRANERTFSVKSPHLIAEIIGLRDTVSESESVETEPVIDSASVVPKIDWVRSAAFVFGANAGFAAVVGALWFFIGRRRLARTEEVVLG